MNHNNFLIITNQPRTLCGRHW